MFMFRLFYFLPIRYLILEEHVPLLGRTYKHTPPGVALAADTNVDHYVNAAAAAADAAAAAAAAVAYNGTK